jgi:hypothetical protein
MRLVPIYRYATIYIFSKQRRFYLYIYTCGLQNRSLKRDFYKDFNGIISKTKWCKDAMLWSTKGTEYLISLKVRDTIANL